MKALKAFTKSNDFCDLHTLMKVGEPPKKVNKICKLNISGVKLTRAKESQKAFDEESAQVPCTSTSITQEQQQSPRKRSCRMAGQCFFMCVLSESTMENRKIKNNKS